MLKPAFRLLLLTLLGPCSLLPVQATDEYVIPPAKREHWAWQRPVRLPLPQVKDAHWVRNPIDHFILARLEAASLKPSPRAPREQLLRRVTLDLIGLPPTLEEIDAFLQDESPDAWGKVVDRLLASPHYGERWGRHWLDLARFAESNGYEFDEVRPDAWRYRDYVIAAFNADKPYDRFIHEQLAGDELFPDEPYALIATGFNLLGPDMTDASEQTQRRQNTLNDMTDTSALVFSGLTVACARCHNHKFEPIPQTDYYRLQAFFAPAAFKRDLPIATREQQSTHARELDAYKGLIRPIEEAVRKVEEPYRNKLYDAKLAKLSDEAQTAHQTPAKERTAAQQELVQKTNRLVQVAADEVLKALTKDDRAEHNRLTKELRQFDSQKPAALPVTMGLQDNVATPAKTFLLERGELASRAQEVHAGFPLVLSSGTQVIAAKVDAPHLRTTGRRAALAQWITERDNPLTARVLVNRLWQHHYGRGLVSTPSDFGIRGERPTHPELLDWLAIEFMEHGWSLKHLHRLMLLSETFQQSSLVGEAARRLEPENQLFSRMNRHRLEGEAIRDSLLAVAGRLNRTMGGPGVFPPLPAEMKPTKAWPVSAEPRDHVRRSVYVFVRRNLGYPLLQMFDVPESSLSCPRRERNVTAPQALTLLNSKDVTDAAVALAQRLEQASPDNQERVQLAYRIVLGRSPKPKECELATEFLQTSPLSELCRALLNLNEFVFVD